MPIPRHTPSITASRAIASRWAAMSVAGSGRPCCPKTVKANPAMIRITIVANRCFFIICSLLSLVFSTFKITLLDAN